MDNLYQSNPVANPAMGAGYSAEQSISITNLLYGVWKRKLLILLVFAITMAGVVFWLSVAKPRYTPELRILIESTENAFTQPQSSLNQQRNTVDRNEVTSQVQVLLSSDLAHKVANELNLGQYPEFGAAPKENSMFTELFKFLGIDREPTTQSVNQNVIERYFKKLNVFAVQESRVIAVEFTSEDPELAAKIANTIGTTYVRATQQVKYDSAKDAMTWLSGEIGRLRQTVATSEAAVEEFRARKGLFRSDTTTLHAQELAGINSQMILASAARSEAEARAKSIRKMLQSGGGIDGSRDVLTSTVIQRLREQQVTLQRTVADLQATFLPTHPRMKRLSAEIKNLSAQIRKEVLKIVDSLENEAKVQGAREAELRANLAGLKAKTLTNNQDEITLRALEREAEANRSLLQTFLQRFTEASARQDISALPAGARIISRAQVLGKPTFPRTKPLFLIGVAGAVVLAILIAFVAEIMTAPTYPAMAAVPMRREPGFQTPPAAPAVASATVISDENVVPAVPDVPAAPDVPTAPDVPAAEQIYTETPESKPAKPKESPGFATVLEELPPLMTGKLGLVASGKVCSTDPTGEFALAVRKVFQKLRDAGQAAGTRRFAWTSGEDLEDKVPVLVNLARTFAQSGAKTIVIDTDCASDELEEAFEVGEGVGLSDLLAGRAAFTDAIVRDSATGLHILRQGAGLAEAESLLGSKRMDYILDALDQAYEAVIINVAPMNEALAHQVAPKAGYAVVFAEATKTGKKFGSEAIYALHALGVHKTAGVSVQANGMFNKLLSKYRKAA